MTDNDRQLFSVSIAYGALAILALFVEELFLLHFSPLFSLVLLTYAIHLLALRGHMKDPTVIMVVATLIYATLPMLTFNDVGIATFGFELDGARIIYRVGVIATIVSVGLAALIVPRRQTESTSSFNESIDQTALTAGFISAIFSVGFSALYIMRNGFVLTGDVSYGDSFRLRLEAGSGIAALAAPFAITALCLTLSSGARMRLTHYIVTLLPFLLLVLSLGQRKFLIIPLMILASARIRLRSATIICISLFSIFCALVGFNYLGYLRIRNISWVDALNADSLQPFVDRFSFYMSGETLPVFATASAAYAQFVKPLPYAGDYLLSWMIALPHFIFGDVFLPLNVRFAQTYALARALSGQGWGFSFFAEAYLVGGFAAIFLVMLCMCLMFRTIYVNAYAKRFTGIAGAVCLSSLYYALWFQRNAFAYLMKEFLIYQVLSILLMYALVKLLRTRPLSRAH